MSRRPRRKVSRKARVNPLAWESALGRRLRRIEEALNIPEPNHGISLALVMCAGPNHGIWSSPEGVHVSRDGHVTGTYRLGQYRDVVFWGPRGYSREETEAIHRRKVAELLADPEYSQPYPAAPHLNGERSVRLGDGVTEIVTSEPEPGSWAWAARSRGLLREVDGAVVIRSDNRPWM